ncbi:MAG: cupin domain-containing protein [Candidatus Heimdallarchaeota archaeon]
MNIPTNISEKIKELEGKPWQPIEIATVNNYVIRLALFLGEYHWHKHQDEDELFYVIKGEIIIKIKDNDDIILKEGEIVVIQKGVEHKPVSEIKSYVLLFEPEKLKSKGD